MEISGTSKASNNSDGNLGGSICLYVPEGYHFENTSLDLGAGSLSVEELQTRALEANVGAGKMTFEKLDADQAELDCGAGQMTVEELSSRVAEVSVGMGSVRLDRRCDRTLGRRVLHGRAEADTGRNADRFQLRLKLRHG